MEEKLSNIGGVTLGVNVHTFGLQIDEILKCKDIAQGEPDLISSIHFM